MAENEKSHGALKTKPRKSRTAPKSSKGPTQSKFEKTRETCNNTFVRNNNNQDFIDLVNNNKWDSRRDRGWPWRSNVYQYIFEVYNLWIEQGLIEADFAELDRPLWDAIQRRKRTEPVPSWLNMKDIRTARRDAERPETRKINDQKRALWRQAYHLKGPAP